MRLGYDFCFKLLDKGLLEAIGPRDLVMSIKSGATMFNKKNQTISIYNQISYIFCYILLIII